MTVAKEKSYCARAAGFTLMEILVVIVVISILSAIVYGVFSRVREKGRQATCAGNMRQLGLALLQYSQDYDEHYLSANRKSFQQVFKEASFNLGWAGRIYPYVKNTQSYQCPNDSTSTMQFEGSTQTAYPISYGININLSYEPSVASLRAPAKTVLLFEISRSNAEITRPLEGVDEPETSRPPYASAAGNGVQSGLHNTTKLSAITNHVFPLYATGYIDNHLWTGLDEGSENDQFDGNAGRHSGGANYLCADGHVKWLNGDQVSAGATAGDPNSSQSARGCEVIYNPYVAGRAPCAEGTAADKHTLTFSIK